MNTKLHPELSNIENKLIVLHKPIKTFSISITLFNKAGYHFENVHLFEHLFLEKFFEYLSQKGYDNNPVIQYVNGITLGIGVCFTVNCYHELAEQAGKIMSMISGFDFSITNEEVLREKKIISIENTGLPDLWELREGIDKFYEVKAQQPSTKNILNMYKNFIKNQKPLIVIQGDTAQTEVLNAINIINEAFSSKKEKKNSSKPNLIKEYRPYINRFSGGTGKKVNLYLSTKDDIDKDMFAYTIVTTRLLGELLFEYVRNIENVDYQPQFSPRIMPNEYESSWSFRTSASSDVIMDLLGELFFMKENDFLRLQQKVFYDQLLRWDNIYDTYYWTTQYFNKTGKFISIDESAASILSISYEDFVSYFRSKLNLISLELSP